MVTAAQRLAHSLSRENIIGDRAEVLFVEFLQTKFPKVGIRDVSKEIKYQWQEIDFILTFPDGRVINVEVKADTNPRMPNMCVETISNLEIKRNGWLYTTQATVIAYIYTFGLNSGEPNLWFVETSHLKALVKANNFKAYTINVESQMNDKNAIKTTIGALVPRQKITPMATYYLNTDDYFTADRDRAQSERWDLPQAA